MALKYMSILTNEDVKLGGDVLWKLDSGNGGGLSGWLRAW
jgi:hypothetical protein